MSSHYTTVYKRPFLDTKETEQLRRDYPGIELIYNLTLLDTPEKVYDHILKNLNHSLDRNESVHNAPLAVLPENANIHTPKEALDYLAENGYNPLSNTYVSLDTRTRMWYIHVIVDEL